MTPCQGNTFLVHPSQQLACLCRELLKGFCLTDRASFKGPWLVSYVASTCLVHFRYFYSTFMALLWSFCSNFLRTFTVLLQYLSWNITMTTYEYIQTQLSIMLNLQHYDIDIWKYSKQCKNECCDGCNFNF